MSNVIGPPYALGPDAPPNPAYTSGKPHTQYPFAELTKRLNGQTTSGGAEGANPDDVPQDTDT